jgi:glyoxylase-like metal-dependent hydrolase (beta-lactamase superfamily II)/rhodanese-related sulfurtransferase
MMIFRQLFDTDTSTFTYLLADEQSREAVLIDTVLEQVERDLEIITSLNLKLIYCLDTHVHADHVTGAGVLRERTGCRTAVCASTDVQCADLAVQTGDTIDFGRHQIEVRSTPGHTGGCATYVVRDDAQTLAFTGDTIFIRGCGRTDFQQGDARTLYRSVHEHIYSLPDHTIIYPGHDYNDRVQSTVGDEKLLNPRLKTSISEDEFVGIMSKLKLGMPKKIDVAVPANMGCGVPAAGTTSIGEVSPEQIDALGVFHLIDVREPHEWEGELGHIPEATLIPQADVPKAAQAWDRSQPLLIICRSGRRSLNVGEILIGMGFEDVTNLTGGMIAWNAHTARSTS